MADAITNAYILIVDDDKASRRLLQAQLHIAGFRNLGFAPSGSEGLDMIQARCPDVIVADVMMPGMTGYTFTEKIREQFPGRFIPIILISALQSPEDRVKGIEAGANDFLSRPVDPGELVARINALLLLKQARDALDAERQRLATLYDVSRALTADLNVNAIMQRILTLTRTLTGAEKATLVLLNEKGGFEQKIQARHGEAPRSGQSIDPLVLQRGLLGWVIQHGQAALILDVLTDERWVPLPNDDPARAAVAVPITWSDRVIGGLLLVSQEPGAFHDEHLELLTAICSQAAVALENARLYDEAHRQRARTEALISQTGDPVIVTDPNTRITSFNPAAACELDLDESAMGRPVGNVFSLRLADLVAQASERGVALSGEHTHERVGDHERTFNVSVSPVAGVGFMLVWQDITALKETERIRLEHERAETERVRRTFTRYMSPALVERVLGDPDILIRREAREAVVLFADLRGFTRLTMEHSAHNVMALLNDVFDGLMEIAYRNDGVIFDIAGDELMIAFNVPYDQPDASRRALATAIEMQREFAHLRAAWAARGMRIGMGIGISRGPVVLGHIGGRFRMNYAMVGQAVNIAHRLVDMSEDGKIVITPELMTEDHPDRDKVVIREMQPLTIPGVNHAVPVLCLEVIKSLPDESGSDWRASA